MKASKHYIVVMIMIIATYGIPAFIKWRANPSDWTQRERGSAVLLGVAASVCYLIIFYKDETKKP